jgi:hypothetical protein
VPGGIDEQDGHARDVQQLGADGVLQLTLLALAHEHTDDHHAQKREHGERQRQPHGQAPPRGQRRPRRRRRGHDVSRSDLPAPGRSRGPPTRGRRLA